MVLLTRDVIDALVLDLHSRATRANDLWLEEENGKLLLKAADASSLAILRRLSRGLLGSGPSRAAYDWKYIEFLRGDPNAVKNGAGYHVRIERLPPGEIAGLCSSLPYLHAAELLTLLPDELYSMRGRHRNEHPRRLCRGECQPRRAARHCGCGRRYAGGLCDQ